MLNFMLGVVLFAGVLGLTQVGKSIDVPCPFCREKIKQSATKCRYCQSDVPSNARQNSIRDSAIVATMIVVPLAYYFCVFMITTIEDQYKTVKPAQAVAVVPVSSTSPSPILDANAQPLPAGWTYYKDIRAQDFLLVNKNLPYRGESMAIGHQGVGSTRPRDCTSVEWTDAIANNYLADGCELLTPSQVPVEWRNSLTAAAGLNKVKDISLSPVIPVVSHDQAASASSDGLNPLAPTATVPEPETTDQSTSSTPKNDNITFVDADNYVDTVRGLVASRWSPPSGFRDRWCSVTFKIGSDGNTSDVIVSRTSGSDLVDAAARAAVDAVIAPLPSDAPKSIELTMTFDMLYHRVTGEVKKSSQNQSL